MLDIERKIKQRARRSERRTNGYPDFKKSWRLSAETAEMMMSTAQQNTHIMQRHLLIRRDGNEFHSLFRVHSTTSWASTIQVFFDMVPAEAANLSYLVAKQKKNQSFLYQYTKVLAFLHSLDLSNSLSLLLGSRMDRDGSFCQRCRVLPCKEGSQSLLRRTSCRK